MLARYRPPRNLIAVGRVDRVGEVVDPMLRRRNMRVVFERDAPFPEFEGAFMCFNPEPKLGDEVACVFNQNIFGRHPVAVGAPGDQEADGGRPRAHPRDLEEDLAVLTINPRS